MTSATGRPDCQFYLALPALAGPEAAQAFLPTLEKALAAHEPASVLLSFTTDDPVAIGDAVAILQPAIQSLEAACVLAGDPALAKALDCDGAHIAAEDMPPKAARTALGNDRILGVDCGFSRHHAMTAAEQGADYVCFGPFFGPEHDEASLGFLLGWWQEMMEVPCVATGATTPEQRDALYAAGADFVMVTANA
jgi:thiamine-phosphate pyrophosphorylase